MTLREAKIRKELRYLRTGRPRMAGYAEARIARFGRDALPHVIHLSRSRRPQLRYYAAMTLRLIGGREAIDRLEELLKDRDERVQYDAQMALTRMKDRRAARLLYRVMCGDFDFIANINMAQQGFLARPFIHRLLQSKDLEIKAWGMRMAVDDFRTLPSVRKLLSDPNADVRFHAKDALFFLDEAEAELPPEA